MFRFRKKSVDHFIILQLLIAGVQTLQGGGRWRNLKKKCMLICCVGYFDVLIWVALFRFYQLVLTLSLRFEVIVVVRVYNTGSENN